MLVLFVLVLRGLLVLLLLLLVLLILILLILLVLLLLLLFFLQQQFVELLELFVIGQYAQAFFHSLHGLLLFVKYVQLGSFVEVVLGSFVLRPCPQGGHYSQTCDYAFFHDSSAFIPNISPRRVMKSL
ncbi:MAG: hypothetical protein D6730_04295 [Bacteroidetes bacterium]|nr:MAG: hypothetical protein D6730_04295 [Bacteroidota bacterium]